MQTHINIRTDSEVKERAQALFAQLGLDMTTAVNLFLRQALRVQAIPFEISMQPAGKHAAHRPQPRLGGWENKLWIADDFDAPLEDFKEYM